MSRLCDLADKYGCDKAPSIRHSYTPFYHQLFQGRCVRALLEVGVLEGASLRMWRDYFPEAEIVGFDIEPGYMVNGEERIQTFLCNGTDGGIQLHRKYMPEKFDIIIDDASHEPDDQVAAVNNLMPFLADGGVYVIEDVWSIRRVSKALQYSHAIQVFKSGNAALEIDDVLIVIEKERP
jgi:hypothetical protein